MRRGLLLPVVIACSMPLLAAGCGSSGSSDSSSGTASAKSAKTKTSGGLQTDTTPRYASPASSEPVQSGLVQITYSNIAIDPDTVRAKVGSTIEWTNNDPQKCNVTSEGGPYKFSSGDFGEGGTFELKLDKQGTIHYEW